jgi:NhaP-type Na+/H+ or K+/H+ antiporter
MSGAVALTVVAVLYAVVAARLDAWSIGAPIVFMVAGVLAGQGFLGLVDVSAGGHPMQVVTEATLALVLFADASTLRLAQVGKDAVLPTRLLAVGLPLTIALGTLAAFGMLSGVTWAAAALLATVLAPTDAALSLPVVTNPSIPSRVRRVLNVESGLNDGIATPIVTVLLAVVAAEEGVEPGWVGQAVRAVVLAVVVAGVVGGGGGWLLRAAAARGWTTDVSQELAVLGMAGASYLGAVWLSGNGFVAAFVAGLLFAAGSGSGFHRATAFTETAGVFLSFAVWALFGAALVGPVLRESWSWTAVGYALLSLTVLRMLPVALALLGARLRPATVLFVGWFGPRGLASVVFLTLAVDELHVGTDDLLVRTATWTILLSVVLHGLSARPLVQRYTDLLRANPDAAEHVPGPEPRLRRRGLVAGS